MAGAQEGPNVGVHTVEQVELKARGPTSSSPGGKPLKSDWMLSQRVPLGLSSGCPWQSSVLEWSLDDPFLPRLMSPVPLGSFLGSPCK